MRRVEQHTVAEARDFFERLDAYSAEYVRVALPQVHSHWPTTNRYEEWKYERPIGNVLHYTAGDKYAGTIRHFVLQHRASSNWLVGKSLDQRFDALRKDLDLDRDLRAEAIQLVSPEFPAWHAGWVNRLCTGLEVRNVGILRPILKGKSVHFVRSLTRDDFFACSDRDVEDLDFYWWLEGWTKKFTGEVTRVRGINGVSWWESWSRGSVATVIIILRYLNSLHPGKLDPAWLLAHHNTNSEKNDVVLPLDLRAIRDAVLYSREHVDEIEWLAELDDFEDSFHDEDDPWILRELDERQADRAEEDLDDFNPRRIEGRVDDAREAVEGLRRLGYCTTSMENVLKSVKIFQRSRNLTVDGVIGPQTCAQLERELRSWRLK